MNNAHIVTLNIEFALDSAQFKDLYDKIQSNNNDIFLLQEVSLSYEKAVDF